MFAVFSEMNTGKALKPSLFLHAWVAIKKLRERVLFVPSYLSSERLESSFNLKSS